MIIFLYFSLGVTFCDS